MSAPHSLIKDPKWAARFMNLAFEVASWSKDPSTKVGAVVVDARRRVLGVGYNGFPSAIPDEDAYLTDRPTKYALTVHAEINAMENCSGQVAGAGILFLTHPPCAACALQIAMKKAVEVNFAQPSADLLSRWAESLEAARRTLDLAKIPMFARDFDGVILDGVILDGVA